MLIPRTMAKIGRNDPCPCGSGTKLKRCCMTDPTAAQPTAAQPTAAQPTAAQPAAAQPAAAQPAVSAVEPPSSTAEPQHHVCACCGREPIDDLNDRADYILERLLDGHVDEAETLCLEFIRDFPDDAEGHDLLSMICEDRGQREQALSLLRKASRIAHDRPDYDAETRLIMRQRIKELELCA